MISLSRTQIALLAFPLMFAACQATPSQPSPSPTAARPTPSINIVASIYPIAFLAERIAGETANVTTLTPAGAEPHTYEPTGRDLARIADSDLLLLVGSDLEPWGPRIREQYEGGTPMVLVLGEPHATRTHQEDGVEHADPHVWLDPLLASQMATTIAAELARIDPSNSALFTANVARLTDEFTALHVEYSTALASCATRTIVTSHDAFGYLAARYDLETRSIAGLSPEEEPSAQQLAAIATFVRDTGIRTIFTEHLMSPRLAETIAAETGATMLVLDPIGSRTSEQERGGAEYFSLMRANLVNLQAALVCTNG